MFASPGLHFLIFSTQRMPNMLSSADRLLPFQMEKYDPTHDYYSLKFHLQSDDILFVLSQVFSQRDIKRLHQSSFGKLSSTFRMPSLFPNAWLLSCKVSDRLETTT